MGGERQARQGEEEVLELRSPGEAVHHAPEEEAARGQQPHRDEGLRPPAPGGQGQEESVDEGGEALAVRPVLPEEGLEQGCLPEERIEEVELIPVDEVGSKAAGELGEPGAQQQEGTPDKKAGQTPFGVFAIAAHLLARYTGGRSPNVGCRQSMRLLCPLVHVSGAPTRSPRLCREPPGGRQPSRSDHVRRREPPPR